MCLWLSDQPSNVTVACGPEFLRRSISLSLQHIYRSSIAPIEMVDRHGNSNVFFRYFQKSTNPFFSTVSSVTKSRQNHKASCRKKMKLDLESLDDDDSLSLFGKKASDKFRCFSIVFADVILILCLCRRCTTKFVEPVVLA